jgi:hypothetical protein
MDQVSVVAKDSAQNENIGGVDVSDHADNKADDGAKVGALSGDRIMLKQGMPTVRFTAKECHECR